MRAEAITKESQAVDNTGLEEEGEEEEEEEESRLKSVIVIATTSDINFIDRLVKVMAA